ncbi:MAG: hypothetical protein HXX08_11160 [Chloroflexi bacterium]|uniref:C2H2-type domain-containing protein n=1 Tax=Candidatus Chlorohelix allophototropha TaxID=3003348 RepID=A0A8T7LZH1_9CHLR|nr:hypothetical protein [Chloroflexota bacterium]WJW65795.1 hypothetical protein OZ401_001574 [Chloroflexota bacterium L227-S17]
MTIEASEKHMANSDNEQEVPDATQDTRYKCQDCDGLFEESEVQTPLYECGNCGEVFNRDNSNTGSNHQCPNCYRMASKQDDISCPDCTGGAVEEVTIYICDVCSEEFEEEEEYTSHYTEQHTGGDDDDDPEDEEEDPEDEE